MTLYLTGQPAPTRIKLGFCGAGVVIWLTGYTSGSNWRDRTSAKHFWNACKRRRLLLLVHGEITSPD
jgi:hypothetical protein